jgi:hypothetical protein
MLESVSRDASMVEHPDKIAAARASTEDIFGFIAVPWNTNKLNRRADSDHRNRAQR